MLAAKPNRMRVEVTADDKHRLYLYDGKNFTVWGKLDQLLRTVPAPPTIGELFEQVQEKYDIELPLIDLFKWGTNEDDINKIKTAVDVGPSYRRGCNLRAVCLPPGRRRLADLDSARRVSSAAQASHHDPHRRRQAAAQRSRSPGTSRHPSTMKPSPSIRRRMPSASSSKGENADTTEKGK